MIRVITADFGFSMAIMAFNCNWFQISMAIMGFNCSYEFFGDYGFLSVIMGF